jgi:hypothetical protein
MKSTKSVVFAKVKVLVWTIGVVKAWYGLLRASPAWTALVEKLSLDVIPNYLPSNENASHSLAV